MRSKTIVSLFALCVLAAASLGQQTPPEPGPAKSVSVPAVKERRLPNGMTVAVIERRGVPIVSVQMLVKSGASLEDIDTAGLANLTASMLTKGTKSRTATQIAEEIEFLGGTINSGAGWNNSSVTVTVTSDKLDNAMEIMSDVVRNPSFKQEELDLLKSQALDGLTYNLKQPGFLANYIASKYSYGEHPAGGTPRSLAALTIDAVRAFHVNNFRPEKAVLIFAGDVTEQRAVTLAEKLFGSWRGPSGESATTGAVKTRTDQLPDRTVADKILVVDLPNSGQAAVSYQRKIDSVGRRQPVYYPATVLNSVLGGGYSSRLNQEIRIKRGLSYGARSGFTWRDTAANFSASTQTKNESAPEVLELILAEVKRLTEGGIPPAELTPRKAVLTGGFGRNLETTAGLANALADLYSFGVPTSELNAYVGKVNAVGDPQIKEFAGKNLLGGDVIIVGDYSVFKDELARRFPNMKIEVIKADDVDLTNTNLGK